MPRRVRPCGHEYVYVTVAVSVRLHVLPVSVQPLGQVFTFAGYDQHRPLTKVPLLHDREELGAT